MHGPEYPNGPHFRYDADQKRIDPISLEEFRAKQKLIILGNGYVYSPKPLARWLVSSNTRKDPYTSYRLTVEELVDLQLEEKGGKIVRKGKQPSLRYPQFNPSLRYPQFNPMMWSTDIALVEDPPGTWSYYERDGVDGQRLVRRDFQDGRRLLYNGPSGQEEVVGEDNGAFERGWELSNSGQERLVHEEPGGL